MKDCELREEPQTKKDFEEEFYKLQKELDYLHIKLREEQGRTNRYRLALLKILDSE